MLALGALGLRVHRGLVEAVLCCHFCPPGQCAKEWPQYLRKRTRWQSLFRDVPKAAIGFFLGHGAQQDSRSERHAIFPGSLVEFLGRGGKNMKRRDLLVAIAAASLAPTRAFAQAQPKLLSVGLVGA